MICLTFLAARVRFKNLHQMLSRVLREAKFDGLTTTHTQAEIFTIYTQHTLGLYTGDFYIDLLHFPIRLHISKLRRAGEYWI